MSPEVPLADTEYIKGSDDKGEGAGKIEEVLESTELTQEIMNASIDHVDVFEGDRIHIHWKSDPE